MAVATMKNQLLNLVFTITLAWTTSPCFAQPASGAPIIRIGIDQATLPFSDRDTDSGLEVEVIREAFESQNLRTQFQYLSNARVDIEFTRKRIDMHTSAKPGASFENSILTRFPIVTLRNKVIYLKTKGLKIKTIADLSQYRVMAWQGAKETLGAQYAAMAKANLRYTENPNMPAKMLELDRVDFFVSQPDIFRANLIKEIPKAQRVQVLGKIEYVDLLPKAMRYWYAFNDPGMRDAFEKGIGNIYNSGRMEALLAKYQEDYGTSREYFIELDCRFLKNHSKCPN